MAYHEHKNKHFVDMLDRRGFSWLPPLSIELLRSIDDSVGSHEVCFRVLDRHFENSFKKSFNGPTFLIYNETINLEAFLILNKYFSNRACNIENIYLVTSTSIGLSDFAKQYASVMQTSSVKILELPFFFDFYIFKDQGLWNLNIPKEKKLKYYFTYYGGTYEGDPPDRTLLYANFKSRPNCYVDFMGTACTKQKLINYVEQLTGFCDQNFVEFIGNNYDNYVDPTHKQQVINTLPLINSQWDVDSKALLSITRETSNRDPWATITEKTIRCFLFGIVPMPINGSSLIEYFEREGFLFDHNLLNYNYLKEKNFATRLKQINYQLDLTMSHTLEKFEKYYIDNYDLFEHNARHLLENYETNINKVAQDFINSL
jgi:hypothetical protein